MLLLAALVAANAHAASLVIDSFTNGAQFATLGGSMFGSSPPNTASGVFGNNPIGNARTIIAGKFSDNGIVDLTVVPADGYAWLDASLDGLSQAIGQWNVEYGTVADLNLDLSGATDFQFDFQNLTGSATVSVSLATTGVGLSFAQEPVSAGTSTVSLPMSAFSGSADYANVDQINVGISTGQPGFVGYLTSISVDVTPAPEPGGALTFCGLVAPALFLCWRRRVAVAKV